MSFKQLYNDGAMARRNGKALFENPFFRPENLPLESASAYRAWQIKAEAWERGWRSQERLARPLQMPLAAVSGRCA